MTTLPDPLTEATQLSDEERARVESARRAAHWNADIQIFDGQYVGNLVAIIDRLTLPPQESTQTLQADTAHHGESGSCVNTEVAGIGVGKPPTTAGGSLPPVGPSQSPPLMTAEDERGFALEIVRQLRDDPSYEANRAFVVAKAIRAQGEKL